MKFVTPTQRERHYLDEAAWMERYGDHVVQARLWRRTALASLAIAAISSAGAVWIGSQNRITPYVVEVDKLGAAVAVGRADQARRPDRRIIVAQLARWIADVRSVYADAAAQRALVTEAYAMVNQRGPAYGALNEHMRRHDPFKRARTETVSVEVQSALPISADSWRIEWRETVRGRDGKPGPARQYQATVTISFRPPEDEAAIRVNPAGLYIDSFSWAQRL
jgi:type IV secretory pathway TrbF-like protein